jgi:hypothetical protein
VAEVIIIVNGFDGTKQNTLAGARKRLLIPQRLSLQKDELMLYCN